MKLKTGPGFQYKIWKDFIEVLVYNSLNSGKASYSAILIDVKIFVKLLWNIRFGHIARCNSNNIFNHILICYRNRGTGRIENPVGDTK